MKLDVFLLLTCCLVLFSCATPSEKFTRKADEMGFKGVIVDSGQFRHRVYVNKHIQQKIAQPAIHVYLDGDGTPWEKHRWITDDPTSRNHLVLRMMEQDSSPAILLGRPCYLGLSQSAACHNKYWTTHRYSQEIVSSMIKALNSWLQSRHYKEVVLIGYSGGGVLAMLMAPVIKSADSVVTVAANLDVVAWSRLHGYSPLSGSLNPADFSLPRNIKQFHLSGGRDDVVPEHIVKKIAKKNSQAKFMLFEQYTHQCCWDDDWSRILATIFLVR